VGTALACYSLKFVRTVLFVNFAYDKIFCVYKNTLVNSTPGSPTGRGTLEESYACTWTCADLPAVDTFSLSQHYSLEAAATGCQYQSDVATCHFCDSQNDPCVEFFQGQFQVFPRVSLCVEKGESGNITKITVVDVSHISYSLLIHSRSVQSFLRRGWLGSRVVNVLDSGAEGPGFKSQSRRCRVTVLGKLFTPVVPLFTKQQNW